MNLSGYEPDLKKLIPMFSSCVQLYSQLSIMFTVLGCSPSSPKEYWISISLNGSKTTDEKVHFYQIIGNLFDVNYGLVGFCVLIMEYAGVCRFLKYRVYFPYSSVMSHQRESKCCFLFCCTCNDMHTRR